MRKFTALLGAGLLMVSVVAYANDMATGPSGSPPVPATTNPVSVPPTPAGTAPKVATDFATRAGLMQPVFAENASGTSGASVGSMATYIAPGIPGVIAPILFYCDSSHCTLTPPATDNTATDPLAAH